MHENNSDRDNEVLAQTAKLSTAKYSANSIDLNDRIWRVARGCRKYNPTTRYKWEQETSSGLTRGKTERHVFKIDRQAIKFDLVVVVA